MTSHLSDAGTQYSAVMVESAKSDSNGKQVRNECGVVSRKMSRLKKRLSIGTFQHKSRTRHNVLPWGRAKHCTSCSTCDERWGNHIVALDFDFGILLQEKRHNNKLFLGVVWSCPHPLATVVRGDPPLTRLHGLVLNSLCCLEIARAQRTSDIFIET
eukprot:c20413_g1_i1.p1 GENE.c20413_g1_i1~~c20413_g1_i1.p1  ORF type:complete len:157 (-),score=6.51 c20413_g1_i1:371-841(-)